MSGAYRGILARRHRVYAIKDIIKLYGVSQNTVTNWIKAGFTAIPDTHPKLFRGDELRRFHSSRSMHREGKLALREFNCLSCRVIVIPEIKTLEFESIRHSNFAVLGACPDCGKYVHKFANATTCETLKKCIESQSSPEKVREEKTPFSPEIVISKAEMELSWNSENEKITYEYQTFLNKYKDRTASQHLAAIRVSRHL